MAATSFMGGTLTVRANGPRLKGLRKSLGFKQQEVERRCGIPFLRLSQYETGKPINLYHLRALAKFYVVPPRELATPESVAQLEDFLRGIVYALGLDLRQHDHDPEILKLDCPACVPLDYSDCA